jgi:hypothetical protein
MRWLYLQIALGPVLPLLAQPPAQGQFVTGVTVRATSEQVPGYIDADNLVSEEGLEQNPPGSGRFILKPDARGWNSNYGNPNDETPIVQFDLQKVMSLRGFHVWNVNAKDHLYRGFKNVTVLSSQDGKTWKTVPQRFVFAAGTGNPNYAGERHTFTSPVVARYIRFCCDSTWRGPFGQPDVAGLAKVRFLPGTVPERKSPAPLPYPPDSGLINVKEAPYLAKGDGVSDDTEALQRAILDWQATRHTIFLPDGTYLVSASLRFKLNQLYGENILRGQSREKTILRLKDNTFTDLKRPQAVLFIGRRGDEEGKGLSADWFHNHVSDLTIDTGRGNPAAIGLQFYSNNTGSVRNLTLRSGDGTGAIGLDLGFADQNGPHYVKNVTVTGFDTGVRCGATVNSQTLEHITLRDQRVLGLLNDGQCLTVRKLTSDNAVPAVQSKFGFLTLVDATLNGKGAAKNQTAITSGEFLFARNVTTMGYARAIENKYGNGPNVPGPNVTEYTSARPVLKLFDSPARSLNLPILETPEVPMDPAAGWANVRHFREITDVQDDTAAVQRAIDSGASTIYFPTPGTYIVRKDILLRGNVRRVMGMFAYVRCIEGAKFRVVAGTSPIVVVEGLSGNVENASSRTLVVRDGQGNVTATGAGDVFIEDCVGDFEFGRQRVWARQVNAEKLGTKVINSGGTLWILGLKTERGGTLIETKRNGKTELLGGLCYTTIEGGLAPMFVNTESSLSAVIGEVCYTGDPFRELVRETRSSVTRTLKRGEAPLRFSFMQGSAIPLYVGARPAVRPPAPRK